jgi:hypothetical protein
MNFDLIQRHQEKVETVFVDKRFQLEFKYSCNKISFLQNFGIVRTQNFGWEKGNSQSNFFWQSSISVIPW